MMRKAVIYLVISAICIQPLLAAAVPVTWWPSFGFDEKKNAVCPWHFAPPIIQDKTWNVKFQAGIWSQPVATDKFIAFVTDTDNETGKAAIHLYNIAENAGTLRKTQNIDILPSAGLNRYDKPITTPAIGKTASGEPILVFGDGYGRIVRIAGQLKSTDSKIKGNDFGFGSSPTICDGRIYISSDSGMSYIIGLDDQSEPIEMKTSRLVTASPSVWDEYVMFGDNSGKFYIFDRNTGIKKKELAISGIDAIRSSACISTQGEKTYAFFGSNRGKVHRLRLDDKSFELVTLDANIGQTNTEFWATPTVFDGNIYIGNENGFLYKIDCSRMAIVDRIRLDGNSIFSQATANNGFLYVTTGNRVADPAKFDGALFIIDLATFKAFQNFGMIPIEGGAYSSPVFAGGRLFVASRSGRVYCFKGTMPEISVNPPKVTFRQIGFDTEVVTPVRINISNSTRYTYLDAKIMTDPPDGWLRVSSESLASNAGNIDCWIDLGKVTERSGRLEGAIIVETTFGMESKTARIPVEASFEAAPPKFMLSKPLISHKARDLSRIVDPLKVQLRQFNESSEMSFEVSTADTWFEVNKKMFTLTGKSGESSIDLAVIIEPERLLAGNPGKLEYSGSFVVQGIFRNKPYNPVTVKVTLSIEKALTLIAIPEISELDRTYRKSITEYYKTHEDNPVFVFTNGSTSASMSIPSKPAIDYGNSEIKDFVALPVFPLEESDGKIALRLKCKLSGFKPGKTYKATITVVFNTGKEIPLTVEYNAVTPDAVKIKFVIGSTSYWVNDALQTEKLSASPYISRNGNTMVPIRPISEPLGFFYGAKIEWVPDISTVLFTLGNRTLRLVIGHNKAYIDNEDGSITETILASPPEIVGGRTFIPPRIIADTFGGKSEWAASSKTVVFEFKKPR